MEEASMVGIDLVLSDHLLLILLVLAGASFAHGLLGIGFPRNARTKRVSDSVSITLPVFDRAPRQ